MDKFQMWRDPLPDSNLEDYTNNFSAYSFRESDLIPYQSLMFRMHTDYPFDQLTTGIWRNGNPYFAISSSAKLYKLYGEPNADVDYMISYMPWSGSTTIVYDSGSCKYASQSVYPYQFKVIDYPSTWGISKYGPNRFRNEKVRHVSQEIEARFDNLARSTYVPSSATAPDSNQVGFFVDPQDFKNRDVVRYFGSLDFMDVIGDPGYQFSQSYDSLKLFRKEYAENRNQYSGSRTLFNELLTTYKLYFNRSIFDNIKNVIPARTNALMGVVIEPTILERPKYQMKPISSEVDYALDAPVHHYVSDTASLVGISATLIPSGSIDLGLTYISYPNRDYPINYGGNYIKDLPDDFELGHFAAGVPTRTIDFIGTPVWGYAPLNVQFTNRSFGASSYYWDFGDGSSRFIHPEDVGTGQINPLHSYTNPGIYTVTLTGYYGEYGRHKTRDQYITVVQYPITADFDANPKSGQAPLEVRFSNLSTNAQTYHWDFGNGATSTLYGPTQSYLDPGLYNVSLAAYTPPYVATHVSNSYISVGEPAPMPDDCDGPHSESFAGGNYGAHPYLQQYVYSLGHLQTPMTFSYNVGTSAARYLVNIGVIQLLDTQWVSDTPDQSQIDNINNALIPYGTPPTWLSASVTNVVAAVHGDIYFNKTSPNNVTTVQIYNPFFASCSFTMSCPTAVPLVPPTPSAPVTYSCGTTVMGSSDGNGNPYPYVFGINFAGHLCDENLTIAWSTNYPIKLVLYYKGNPQTIIVDLPDFGYTIYDGWLLANFGYRGAWSEANQILLWSALVAKGEPLEFALDNVSEAGISFDEKQFFGGGGYNTPASSTNILGVWVYAPIPGTVYSVTVSCPHHSFGTYGL